MNKATKKRMSKVEEQFASVPIPPKVVKAAFEKFRSTGELPEDVPLAYLVIDTAKRGECVYGPGDQVDWGATIQAVLNKPKRADDPLMDELYNEAVFGDGMVQAAARQTLRALAGAGFDPSQPQFAGKDMELPNWGGVGIQFLGIPQRLAKPPYEQQAERLFVRYEVLRDRIPQGDRVWSEQLDCAVRDFQERGELPADQLMRDVVLGDAEVQALMQHLCGEDVSQVMAALDAVQQSSGVGREAALVSVQQLFRRMAATSAG
jgi:hypothetical protein